MDLRNLIHENHPCYFIKNVVDLIDCSKANQEFRGKPSEFVYLRELLLRLILMSIFDGGLSSREIGRITRTNTNIVFKLFTIEHNLKRIYNEIKQLNNETNT